MEFKKASKESRKLKMIIAAPSGGGKTYSALRIGTGILAELPENQKGNGRIALIDTEGYSASNYGNKFDFDTLGIDPPFEMKDFSEAIKLAKENKYPVLILDSGSHAWKQVLAITDKITKADQRHNSYAAWRTGTAIIDNFLENLIYYPGHVIMCLRSKMEYAMEQNSNGKNSVTKLGLAPVMRNEVEYEFDMMMDGTIDHFFEVTKTRYEEFDKLVIEKPDEEFGKKLIRFVADIDADVPVAPEPVKTAPKPKAKKATPKPDNKKYEVESEPVNLKEVKTKDGNTVDLSAAMPYNQATMNPDLQPICARIQKGWQMLKYNDYQIANSIKKHLGVSTLNEAAELAGDQADDELTGYLDYLIAKFKAGKK